MTTSEEELTDAYPRQPTVITLKTGVGKDGLLIAREGKGAAGLRRLRQLRAGDGGDRAADRWRDRIARRTFVYESVAVYTNKGPTGSFRAPAGPMGNFAVRSQIDLIADDLGIDPLEFRLRNVYREGDKGRPATR